jgi:hypothetical protein
MTALGADSRTDSEAHPPAAQASRYTQQQTQKPQIAQMPPIAP